MEHGTRDVKKERIGQGLPSELSPPRSPTLPLPEGWDKITSDVRLREYAYYAIDRVEDPAGSGKLLNKAKGVARVVMYNPSAELLAVWIANAVIELSPDQQTYCQNCAYQLVKVIAGQSNAQFPVVGVVYEDIQPSGNADGKEDAYGFLDGMTVVNAPSAFFDKSGKRVIRALTDGELEQALGLSWSKDKASPGKFARIASTERWMVEYLFELMGKNGEGPKAEEFAAYTRKQYIAAMKGVRNELIVAKMLSLCRPKPEGYK